MDLVPVTQRKEESSKPGEFIVPVQRQQQIGVTYAEVRRRHMRFDIRSVGTLEVDQAQIFECVTRVDGYIEELQVTSPGERVAVGQPLMTIYSPDLRAPEQELVNLLKVQVNGSVTPASMDQLINFARRRLQLLNVGPTEISELERTGQPTDRLVFRSTFERSRERGADEGWHERETRRQADERTQFIGRFVALGELLRERGWTFARGPTGDSRSARLPESLIRRRK